jgi:hypothetical protein
VSSTVNGKIAGADVHTIYNIQKADRYLVSWQAQLMNPMGRTVLLINAACPRQLVGVLQLPSSVIQQLDKRRWAGGSAGQVSPAGA